MTHSRRRGLNFQSLESRCLLACLATDTAAILPAEPSQDQPVVADSAASSMAGAMPISSASMVHADDPAKLAEHQALLALLPMHDADAVAIASGNWSDPAIWQSNLQPVPGGKVLIAEGIQVTFDAQLTVPIKWLRVNGQLSWCTDLDTTLMVETLVVTGTGELNIGTVNQPIQPDVTATVLIDTSGGAIDPTADPALLGRGLISHGRTQIHGAVKTSRVTSQGDIAAGQTELVLNDAVEGWRVGDQLLIPGTSTDRTLNVNQYDQADAANARFRDDVVTIAAINGNQITLASGTAWAHVRPSGATFTADELSLYVINLTRNVVVRSSDASVPNQQRGHVMIMHNPDADIAFAQFKDLGRSDKRLIVDDPGTNMDGSLGNGGNPRGRYGLHLHRIGSMSYDGPAAHLTGNVIWGTPGWGIVQHDSHAVLRDNVVFDVVGAGIVTENGNEIGEWIGNTVVKITGDLINNFDDGAFFNTARGSRFDLGFTGSGYWVQGGGFGLLMRDNVAASINGAGFDLVHHTDGLRHVEVLPVSLIYDPAVRQRYVDAGVTAFTPNNVPMRGMSGVEVYNANRGIHTWLHNRDSQDQEGAFTFGIRTAHDIKSVISDYTVWGVNNGVQNFYSTLMRYENGLVVGNIDSPIPFIGDNQGNNSKGSGISHNEGQANRIDFEGLRVEGFQYGFQTFIPHNDSSGDLNPLSVSSINHATFANVSKAFIPSSTNIQTPFSKLFSVDNVSAVGVTGSAFTPDFTESSRGGLSLLFSATVQPDYVGYMWDFDNDGQFDDGVGASEMKTYLTPGAYTVGLRVWDKFGRMATTYRTFDVSDQTVGNVLVDPGFSGSLNPNTTRDTGWNGRDFVLQNNTVVMDPNGGWAADVIYQTITDLNRLTGEVDFRFDYRRISTQTGAMMMASVFGVDDYFGIEQWQIHHLPILREGIIKAPNYQQFVHINLAPTSQGQWQSVDFRFDVGQGFKYYFVRFAINLHRAANGDTVGVRNVMLTRAGQTFVPAVADQFTPMVHKIATVPDVHGESLQQVADDHFSAIDELTLSADSPWLGQGNEVDVVHTQPYSNTPEDERRRLYRILLDDWLTALEERGVMTPADGYV